MALVAACGSDDRRRGDSGVRFDGGAVDAPRSDSSALCGNRTIDPGEACDGANLNGQSCETMGGTGTLSCNPNCTFQASGCAAPGCSTGEIMCDGTCTNVTSSRFDCGTCGRECAFDQTCVAGDCACDEVGLVDCGGSCVSLRSADNCGACGVVCGVGLFCSGEGAAASCSASSVDERVILSGGLLAIFIDGVTYGVCDDGFTSVDGEVACRSMGLSYVTHTTSQSGPSGDHYMDDVACTGTELSLFDCDYISLGSENCSSSEWIRLTCE